MIDLNNRILANPQDTELNLRYARLAEERGNLRLALAAYERILINDPENKEAQRGFARVRRIVEPALSVMRVEVGGRWDSNPLNLSDSPDAAQSSFARATWVDERRLGARRWRSVVNFDAELTPDVPELDYGYLGAQTGPIIDVAPYLAAIPSAGVSVATLGDKHYFTDINAGVTLEGQRSGVSFWTRFRANWRSYTDDSTAEEGAQAEIAAGVSIPRVGTPNGSVVLSPWVRWSGIEGSAFNFLNEELAPGEYEEIGLEATYNYRINDSLSFSVGALGHHRYYRNTDVGSEHRSDDYISPQASVTLRNVLPCQCAIRASYRHRNNSSNDPVSDYDGDQVSLSLFAQF